MRLFNGDCLNELKHLPDASIDLIIADPPYGITNCEWDITSISRSKQWNYRIKPLCSSK